MPQVARSRSELETAISRSRLPSAKNQWKYQISEEDPAFLWAQCLAPTYGINILGVRSGLSFRVRFALLTH